MDSDLIYALRDFLIVLMISHPIYMGIISASSRTGLTVAMMLIKFSLFVSYALIFGGCSWLIGDISKMGGEGPGHLHSADLAAPYCIYTAVVLRRLKKDYGRLIEAGREAPIHITAR